jgi:hypothetical protein
MRRFVAILAIVIAGALPVAGASAAFAAANPSGHGQPNQSCEEQPSGPAGFSSPGFAKAELVYAGGDNSHSADNVHAVSQYDVACFQVSSNGH